MATGTNISKANAYAVVAPPAGVSTSKVNAYAVVAPGGLGVSKAVAYAVLLPPADVIIPRREVRILREDAEGNLVPFSAAL